MADRRSFLKSLAAGGAALALNPAELLASRRGAAESYFRVHPFVESHPDAVFIMRSTVDVKTNHDAVRQAGLVFGSSVFVPNAGSGIPISRRVAIKPNIVMMPGEDEQYMGIVTDPCFVEGIIESLKLLGIQSGQFYLREVNNPDGFSKSGYTEMATRTGVDLRDLSAPIGVISEADLQWVDVPAGKWFKRIPFLWPVNDPETWLLNISKLKTHLMGMTLCAKNLQGAIAAPYQLHCTAYSSNWDMNPDDIHPDAKAHILDDYQRHLAAGIPRWDRPGEEGGLWQETWAARCLDNNSVTHPGLHIIEGVYGREGAFWYGPGPNGEGVDHMANVIIFGKNAFHVDTIGLYMGGHEPGNFGLLHMAIERGLSSVLNPRDMTLYEWFSDGTCVPSSLENFSRTELRTNYLRRDYSGQNEDEWHLVNEPYTYEPVTVQLVSFSAVLEPLAGGVILRWSTASETNNQGWEVQRAEKNEASAYETIPGSFVPGSGTTTEPHEYSFTVAASGAEAWYYRLKQIDVSGSVHYSNGILPTLSAVENRSMPLSYSLEQNYPNPYNPTTTIRYTVGELGSSQQAIGNRAVKLAVYDLLGREVAVLVDEKQAPGNYEVRFDGSGLPSGAYFYRIEAGSYVQTRKFVLMK